MGYAEKFKDLWERSRFIVAENVYDEWSRQDPSDVCCRYARIMVCARNYSVRRSQLYDDFVEIPVPSPEEELAVWYMGLALLSLNPDFNWRYR